MKQQPERLFVTAAEVARLLELGGAAQFHRRRFVLERDYGFPPPVPVSARPLKWRRAAVIAWRDAADHLPPPPRDGLPDPARPARRVVMLRAAGAPLPKPEPKVRNNA